MTRRIAIAACVLAGGALLSNVLPLVASGNAFDDGARESLAAACKDDGGLTYQVRPVSIEPYDLTYGCLGDNESFEWVGAYLHTSTFAQSCGRLGLDILVSGGGITLPYPVFMECRRDAD